MKKTAIYPGTFDPITHGHIDLLERGMRIFDKIVIAVSMSAGKSPLFSLEQRLAIVQKIFAGYPQISVLAFSGLLVDVMAEQDIHIMLRGIRTNLDAEYEFQLAGMNQQMKADIETVFLKAHPKFAHVSSSIVREIAGMTKPGSLGNMALFVPQAVIDAFTK